jgi:hypothetical protein
MRSVTIARLILRAQRMLGGAGSGNFNHAGRPGEVGGSAMDSKTARMQLGAAQMAWTDVGETRHALFEKLKSEFFNGDTQPPGGRWDELAASLQTNAEYVRLTDEQNKLWEKVLAASKTVEEVERQERLTKVTRRVTDVAAQMHYDMNAIDIVDEEPREFTVGNLQFHEAGHYNPATDRIQINARNTAGDAMSSTTIVAAHEIAHAQYAAVEKLRQAEHDVMRQLRDKGPTDENGDPIPDPRYFTKWGSVKLEALPELRKKYPASALWADTFGDGFLDATDHTATRDKMIEDDGASAYSRAYWSKAAIAQRGHTYETAVNETLAEVRRMIEVPHGHRDGDSPPSESWAKLAKGIGDLYVRIMKRGAM